MADHIRSEETQPRVFISYARSDGEFAASELRILLEQSHIPLWQDRVKMEGGRDWWLQIIDGVSGCAVSPDGEWIVSCSNDGTLKLWDVRNGQERLTLRDHIGSVNGCAISPDGEWIISCSDDGTLKLWDTYTGALRASVRVDARLETCTFCPNGEHIVAGGEGDVYFLHAVW